MNINSTYSTFENQHMKAKSAFTPILHKPLAIKQSPLNLFEPSPIQKFLYLAAFAQHQAQTFKNVFSPMKVVTPSQFLNIDGQAVTPELLRKYSEASLTQQLRTKAPSGFNYDVIEPIKTQLGNSPLLGEATMSDNTCFNSDQEKDLESTEESQIKRDEEMTEYASENKNKSKSLIINGITIDNFLASDDLNECVDFLLRKQKINLSQNTFQKVIRHNASGKSKEKKRRYRKNCDQHHILLRYFEKNPNWDKQQIQKLSDQLGLKESQIYKWNWDQRKKMAMDE